MPGDAANTLDIWYSFGGNCLPAGNRPLGHAQFPAQPGDKTAPLGVDHGEPVGGLAGLKDEAPGHPASIGSLDTTKQDGLRTLLLKDIAAEIKRARVRAGFSQQQLAVLLGVQQSAISAWETGKAVPELHNRMKLASELKISVSELMPEVVYGPDEHIRDPQVHELVENFLALSPPLRTAIQLTVLQLRDREQNRRA